MATVATIPAKQLEHKGTYAALQTNLMDTEAGWCTEDDLRYIKINGTLVPQSKIALIEYGAPKETIVSYRDRGLVPILVATNDKGERLYLYPADLEDNTLIFGAVTFGGYTCAKCDEDGTWTIKDGPFLDKMTTVSGTADEINVISKMTESEVNYTVSLADAIKSKIDKSASAADDLGKLLEKEIADRISGDNVLDEKITANRDSIDSLEKALADESTARSDGDAALDKKIDANTSAIADVKTALDEEAAARETADNTLSDKISTVEKSLEDEVSARTDADAALEEKIAANSAEAAALAKLLEEETTNRKDGDASLKELIDTKQDLLHDGANIHIDEENKVNVVDRKALAIKSPLTAEITETQLILGVDDSAYARQTDLEKEISDRAAAISAVEGSIATLTKDLANETSAREEGISALQAGMDSLEKALAAETSAREAADASHQTALDALSSELAAEASARETADKDLQSTMNSLDEALTEESTARTAADAALQTSLNDVSAAVTAEAEARETADTQLQANVDAVAGDLATETEARGTGDSQLLARINKVDEDLNAEVQNRIEADAGKQDKYYLFNANTSTSDEVVAAISNGCTILSASGSNAHQWLGSISGGYPHLYRIDGDTVIEWSRYDGKWAQSAHSLKSDEWHRVDYPTSTATPGDLLFSIGSFGVYGYTDSAVSLRLVVKPTDGKDHAIYANGGGMRCDAETGSTLSTGFSVYAPYLRLYIIDTGYWESDTSAKTDTDWTMMEAEIYAFNSSGFSSGLLYRIVSSQGGLTNA